jgi:hypothetical protein
MTTQFLTDQTGKRVAVVLPVEDFDELMEDVSDLAARRLRRRKINPFNLTPFFAPFALSCGQ